MRAAVAALLVAAFVTFAGLGLIAREQGYQSCLAHAEAAHPIYEQAESIIDRPESLVRVRRRELAECGRWP